MKRILAALTLVSLSLISVQAEAHCCYRGGYYRGGGWVAPAIIGGVIGYELARPYYAPPPVVVQQPVIVQQQPVYQQAPAGYHYQQMVNPQTGQTQVVLVPN